MGSALIGLGNFAGGMARGGLAGQEMRLRTDQDARQADLFERQKKALTDLNSWMDKRRQAAQDPGGPLPEAPGETVGPGPETPAAPVAPIDMGGGSAAATMQKSVEPLAPTPMFAAATAPTEAIPFVTKRKAPRLPFSDFAAQKR